MISHRRLFTLAAATLTAAALLGCAPTPDPTPAPLFATEAEAYAAAEQVYREYLAADNARSAGLNVDGPRDFLTGKALESDFDRADYLERENLQAAGEVKLLSFEPTSSMLATPPITVEAELCVDGTESKLLNAAGEDVSNPDRPLLVRLSVKFVDVEGRLLIANSALSPEQTC